MRETNCSLGRWLRRQKKANAPISSGMVVAARDQRQEILLSWETGTVSRWANRRRCSASRACFSRVRNVGDGDIYGKSLPREFSSWTNRSASPPVSSAPLPLIPSSDICSNGMFVTNCRHHPRNWLFIVSIRCFAFRRGRANNAQLFGGSSVRSIEVLA